MLICQFLDSFKASFMEASTKRRIRAEVLRQCVTILKEVRIFHNHQMFTLTKSLILIEI
jgi:hypothetical protein